MLRHRLLFGTLLIAALLGLLYADSLLPGWLAGWSGRRGFDGIIVAIVVAVLALLGSLELGQLLRAAGHRPHVGWAASVSLGLVLLPSLYASGYLWMVGAGDATPTDLTVGLLVIAFAGAFLLQARRRQTDRAIGDMAVTLFAVVYIGLLAQFIVLIRLHGGVALLLYFVATAKCCDIGAYFTGLAFGRHKLIPWLSPKKTWEGLLGGVAASTAFAVGVAYIMSQDSAESPTGTSEFPSLARAAVFGLLMAIVGQCGDLLESLIKRDANSKDSASAIPAFGGVLDILDSVLLTAPVAWLMLLK